ncbi:glutaminase-like isoform X3 [Cloeon dipterum]|uniref:glutaminase-like isoform X3 n=1 Tax=Cloeon dipterum TaxID=197152 RepID=UPI003220397A
MYSESRHTEEREAHKLVSLRRVAPTSCRYVNSELSQIFLRCGQNEDGALNESIPQLAKQDPDLWAASVIFIASNHKGNFGPVTDTRFTIQSIVKILIYAYAASHLGVAQVSDRVKCRGFAVPYNSDKTTEGCAPNVCLNSGALTACAMILKLVHPKAKQWLHVFYTFRSFVQKICGGDIIECDYDTYHSEISTAASNRAILAKLSKCGTLPADVNTEDVLCFYTSCCSLLVNTQHLANMGLVLAKTGKNESGKQVLEPRVAQSCLAQMMQAGLYEQSGDFFAITGLLAKSGVSGGVVAVAHKKIAIGLFSPRLNAYGNSARAVQFIRELSVTIPGIHQLAEDELEI